LFFLKVDTEGEMAAAVNPLLELTRYLYLGHDPIVLDGAKRSLRNGRISVVEFEHNVHGQWMMHTIKDTVSKLDEYGYDCYYLTVWKALVKMTGCWDPVFEPKDWTNCICVDRRKTDLAAYFLDHAYGFDPTKHI
jgi:hypothetical protein